MDSRILFSDLPHVVKAFEALAKESQGSHPSRTFGNPEYERGKCLGLYEDTSDVDGCGAESLAAKRSACTVSSLVVGITYERYDPGYRPWNSSGIVVEYAGVKKILTSAYILGDRSRDAIPLTVDVLLPTRKKLNGVISYIDEQFNIALVETELEELCGAVFSMDVAELGDEVTAVGRTGSFKLMASIGKVNIRGDHLESDDLMSSSCSISERGIGGPLINNSSGRVIGMNFFSKKCSTPFMPSNILLKCVEHLFNHGRVIRRWLGYKTRSMNELKIEELELIYLKFHSFSGVVVKEVRLRRISGSFFQKHTKLLHQLYL